MARKRLLIVSFSTIIADARVLKQVVALRDAYEVTTCGYGEPPEGVARHVRIPDRVPHNVLHDGLITSKQYDRAYWALKSVRWAYRRLRWGTWDIVLADDVEAVPLALRLKPTRGVHADLHEYSPLLHEDWQGWKAKITPYVEWLCRTYVAQAFSWTTVSEGIAREYERNFGFRPATATNAAPYLDAQPEPVGEVIRLVYAGAAMGDRRLEDLVTAVAAANRPVSLDLYLTRNQPAYVDQLAAMAEGTGGRVRVLDPVPYRELATTLRRYDVGLVSVPPTTFNNRWALPNKFFDYVQARLGVVAGPSPEIAEYLARYGFGTVAGGFGADDLAVLLDTLTPELVAQWKVAADASARELSATTQVAVWEAAIAALAAPSPTDSLDAR